MSEELGDRGSGQDQGRGRPGSQEPELQQRAASSPTAVIDFSPLPREEYIEQVHFFKVLGERLIANMPAQEVLAAIREEVLATTKLPLAIEFLLSELKHQGILATGMRQLSHYFSPFQCYVMSEAENDRRRFDLFRDCEFIACLTCNFLSSPRPETVVRLGWI